MSQPFATCPVCRFDARRVFRDDLCTITLEREAIVGAAPGVTPCPAQCCPNLWRAAIAAGITLEGAGITAGKPRTQAAA